LQSGIKWYKIVCKWDEVAYTKKFYLFYKMLIGQYLHTLDPKKRLSLPSNFRKELGKKVVLTNGLDHSIFIYNMKEWEKVASKLSLMGIGNSDTRSFNRFVLSGATEVEVDASGRILIPDFLKKFAGLNEKVVLAGVHNRVEIWDETAWAKYTEKVSGEADILAEKLSQIGIL
jgi:MraZ protein